MRGHNHKPPTNGAVTLRGMTARVRRKKLRKPQSCHSAFWGNLFTQGGLQWLVHHVTSRRPVSSWFKNRASYHGTNGSEAQTPRDRAAQRKKRNKKYAIKGGKVVRRSD